MRPASLSLRSSEDLPLDYIRDHNLQLDPVNSLGLKSFDQAGDNEIDEVMVPRIDVDKPLLVFHARSSLDEEIAVHQDEPSASLQRFRRQLEEATRVRDPRRSWMGSDALHRGVRASSGSGLGAQNWSIGVYPTAPCLIGSRLSATCFSFSRLSVNSLSHRVYTSPMELAKAAAPNGLPRSLTQARGHAI